MRQPVSYVSLSAQQLECLLLIGSGQSTGEIGELLGLSAEAIKGHLSDVLQRVRNGRLTAADTEASNG